MLLLGLSTVFGDPSAALVYRRVEAGAYLKLKGPAAEALYAGLAAEERCGLRGCKRRGADIICSTRNLRDPHVCEIRLGADGQLVGPSGWRLYHSRADNRVYGTVERWEELTLKLDGAAAAVLPARSLRVVDGAAGLLAWGSAP